VISSSMEWNRAEGLLRSRTDPNGLMERHVYDDFGRPLAMYSPYERVEYLPFGELWT